VGKVKHSVARTSPALRHHNTVVLRPTLDVLIDSDPRADELRDSFELVSDDGAYEQRLTRADAEPCDEEHLVLRFTGLLEGKKYSLNHFGHRDARTPIFAEVPYEAITDHGEDAAADEEQEQEKTREQPETEKRDDCHLCPHPSDDAFDLDAYVLDPVLKKG
jgi:hypothetical protein